MLRRAVIEKLAPTGEGLVRTMEGVGLVEGALPGEDVDVEVLRVSTKIWRGRAVAIRSPSAARAQGRHAAGCPACDWAHVEPAAALGFKRDLFRETMTRIGRLPPEIFGELPIEPSPPGYRLRSRFHAEARSGGIALGGFAPRTHRVESLEHCEALSDPMRADLPRIAEALAAAGAPVPSELSTMESLDASQRLVRASLPSSGAGSVRPEAAARAGEALGRFFSGVRIIDPSDRTGRLLYRSGEARLWLPLPGSGREVAAAPGAFFQVNRFLLGPLARHVTELAAAATPGRALDAFGGSGLFAASLLEAGHAVTSVEGDGDAVEAARLARGRWRAEKAWTIVRGPVLDFASRDAAREDVVVVDPPRAGLGIPLAKALAARARKTFVYVSCDPATLARDLAVLVASDFVIRSARLFDLFAMTHRVEAVIALDRAAES